jgi:hypothetical protein
VAGDGKRRNFNSEAKRNKWKYQEVIKLHDGSYKCGEYLVFFR